MRSTDLFSIFLPEQWTILGLRSTSLLSILHTDPLLQFPMLQGAKSLPGPLHTQPEGVGAKGWQLL